MTDEADVKRGQQAQEVLANKEYQQAFTAVEEWIYAEWCKPQSAEALAELRSLLKASRLHRSMMEQVIRNGELAADKIVKRRPLSERLGAKPRTF